MVIEYGTNLFTQLTSTLLPLSLKKAKFCLLHTKSFKGYCTKHFSGASQRNSTAALPSTTQVDVELFYKITNQRKTKHVMAPYRCF